MDKLSKKEFTSKAINDMYQKRIKKKLAQNEIDIYQDETKRKMSSRRNPKIK